MSRHFPRWLTAASIAALVTVTAVGCGGVVTDDGDAGDERDTIVIGASLPLSGQLAGFGGFQKWGYERAVEEVNEAGGIEVDGAKKQVELVVVDDKTDANQVSQNTQTLISRDGVDALLGSCTPALVLPGAVVADRSKVPFVTGCAPLMAFTSAQDWTYAWDIFFIETEVGALPFQTLEAHGVQTNKKVAILHDNGPDGSVVGGQIWPEQAAANGYEVVVQVDFPVDNTDFTTAVQQAKDSGADILLVNAATPQAVSIRKQVATAGYTPAVIQMEKGAEPVQFTEALGDLANGVSVGAYWDPSFPFPGAQELADAYEAETGGGWSQHIADSYTAAKVLLDAIAAAGTTDKEAVNDAIGDTDADYPVGHVVFADDNTAKLDVAQVQWQDGQTVVVYPTELETGELLFPVPAS